MVEIKPCPELDRAVAEAVGFDPRTNASGQTVVETEDAIFQFQPSTDLNAAFAAADEAGLFDHEMRWLRKQVDGAWEVEEVIAITEYESAIESIGGAAATPALAICAAILKLAGHHDD